MMMMSTRKPRVMVVPFPAQGHVKPLLFFAHKLAQHGFRITFVYTDFIHNRILSGTSTDHHHAMNNNNNNINDFDKTRSENIEFVSIPDGLSPEANRNDVTVLAKAVIENMAVHLEKLLLSINGNSSNSNDKISCVVSDVYMGIGMEVAAKMGIEGAMFCPCSVANLCTIMNIPKMIRDGIVDDSYGNSPNQNQIIQLSSGMPSANTSKLPWKDQDLVGQKYGFQVHFKAYECAKTAHWCLFNTTCDIESVALSLFPKFLPIGPLIANRANRLLDISQSQFWANDSSCISWLNQQKDCSVVYIAFGSFTIHEQHQFYELAHGLKLTRRPFLWVVRPGFISSEKAKSTMFDPLHTFLGIENMVGKIVSWAPQQEVLSHPAIATTTI